ncbi:MAG: MFS transporter, partial [Caulobacteraceae bacterium]|nr:MFS transporter [Caulobacteraceae bacterium]
MPADPPSPAQLPRRAFAIIFCVSLATALGNTGMISVLPAIGRSIGIPDPLVVAVFSLSALLWAASSPYWATASDRFGRKPLMIVGLTGFMVSMIGCGIVVTAGLRHWASPVSLLGYTVSGPIIIFVFFLFARAIFGLFGAASNPATQAYVAERTSREERTQSMANLAGAFGLGTVVGPFIAPLFVLPGVGLAGPMFGFALIAAIMLFVVVRFLPEGEGAKAEPPPELPLEAPGGKRRPMWRDPRLIPFLVYGFLVATCQTGQGQTLGFLIIDKLELTPIQAQGFIAVAMMFGAVAGLLAQWGIIRTFRMGPRALLRWGVGVAALGNLLTAVSPNYWTVVVGYAVASLGFGLARPGFTAGSSLAVELHEQARAAGAIAAVNGVNVVLAPLFVMLYERVAPAPFFLNMAVLLGLLAYAYLNPRLKNADPAPAPREET